MERIKKLETYLLEKVPNQDFTRVGITFKTKNKYYFYDTGTGKVLECNLREYQILQSLTERESALESMVDYGETIDNIIGMVEQENILIAPIYTGFVRETDEILNQVLNEQFHQIILEVTQQCNFRCKYCIYHQNSDKHRGFTAKEMPWDIAKAAVEYIEKRSKKTQERVSFFFYGGEPLLRYDFIKKVVEYSKTVMPDTEKSYSFTTNLSLMTKEKADFFAKENFTILCSLDGPQEIHDAYRIDSGHNPTFDKVIKGLRILVDAYGDKAKNKLMINTVLCPPYSSSKMTAIKSFFKAQTWLPAEMQKKYAYVERGTLLKEDTDYTLYPYSDSELNNIENNADGFDPTLNWFLKELIEEGKDSNLAMDYNFDDFVRIHNRLLLSQPYTMIRRNACCTPGGRRIYVDVDGNLKACERVGNAPNIGNVFSGVSIETIKKVYLEDYEKKIMENCSHCWAANLCGLCYTTGFGKGGLDIQRRKKTCESHRVLVKNNLMKYHEVLEHSPDKMKIIAQAETK